MASNPAKTAVDINDSLYYFDARILGKHLATAQTANEQMYNEALIKGKEYKDAAFYKGIAEGIKIAQEAIVQHMKIDEAQIQLDTFMQEYTSQGSGGKCNSQP